MAWSKRWFIGQMLDELGYASYIYNIPPEKLQTCLNRLDTMVADWYGNGINIGWPLPTKETSSFLDQDTNVEDSAHQTIITNGAIRIAPTVGKKVSSDTANAADDGYRALQQIAILDAMKDRSVDTHLPAGAGNKTFRGRSPFLLAADETDIETPNGTLELP